MAEIFVDNDKDQRVPGPKVSKGSWNLGVDFRIGLLQDQTSWNGKEFLIDRDVGICN
jgi:hypothetical protein